MTWALAVTVYLGGSGRNPSHVATNSIDMSLCPHRASSSGAPFLIPVSPGPTKLRVVSNNDASASALLTARVERTVQSLEPAGARCHETNPLKSYLICSYCTLGHTPIGAELDCHGIHCGLAALDDNRLG